MVLPKVKQANFWFYLSVVVINEKGFAVRSLLPLAALILYQAASVLP